jgi:AcrR family transcriptional regulator
MVSTSAQSTRATILDAARKLFEAHASGPVHMADVAASAGISRQAVYLHFPSRADLLLAVVRHVDDVHGFAGLLERVARQPHGGEALGLFIELWAAYLEEIGEISRAIEHLAQTDADAASAWEDRMDGFRSVCGLLVKRLQKDEALAHGWSPADAADLMWTTLSISTWRALTRGRQWSQARYVQRMWRHLERSLVDSRSWSAPERAPRSDRRAPR